MSWVALLLVGLGLADLGHGVRPVRLVPECVAAILTFLLGLVAGLTSGRDLAALIVVAAVVIAWGQTVRHGFGRDRALLPLTLLVVALVAAAATTVWADPAGGALGHWLARTPIPLLRGTSADRALLLLGGLLVQGSTGNVVVRLILLATGTINPAASEQLEPGPVLKGGRLLGPMERLVIVGLGLAGSYTAASLVIAAKGLIRYPELQAARRAHGGPTITEVTEYFLVGSFLSWMVALATLVILAT